ncbi:thiosulfate sulfurtransferase/rhodanese-like domain-containing protein 3 [Ictalurus furcatus]|uniref:Heat shock protein 67b2 n=1 Tax=Ictalurus furcatus TaxID=66913 RepID=E3TCB5_ICTFU|nr:thiosulfate sulfurtransferase/rhodanese-like domain-containing protein 3 [Ictalurus furcatus]ADO27951.1 heat shock protein 67b2 [Ictalurus furcatus]
MALNACCRLTRCVLRVVENRNGAVRALASRCLYQHVGVRTDLWTRRFSSADQPAVSVTYEQVKKLLVVRTGVVIDVREPWELREYGSIPGSINVPLGQLSAALQLKPEEFKEKYGGEMPSIGESLVFTCLAGVRSQKALEAAQSLGYSNVQHYPGGWQDWAKHEILQAKV